MRIRPQYRTALLVVIVSLGGPIVSAQNSALPPVELEYQGEKIDLETRPPEAHRYRVETFLEIKGLGKYQGKAGQGFTVFGQVGFFFYDSGYCRTIDLAAKKIIAEFALPAPVGNPKNHAGQANFGVQYFREGDEFPVLYLSSYLERKCYVLRMTRTAAELVQTLYLTDGTKPDGAYHLLDAQGFFLDNENDKLIVKMGAIDPTNQKYKYWKVFEVPQISEGETVYLFDEKKSDEFYVRTLKGNAPAKRNFVNAGCAANGRIYVNAGFEGATSSLLVIDYEKHKIVTDIRWGTELIVNDEQEQCAIYDGKLLINFNGADRLVLVSF